MSDQDVSQLTAISGCTESQAREVLSKYDGDLERAINSIFDNPAQFDKPDTRHFETSVVPYTGGIDVQHESWSPPPPMDPPPIQGPQQRPNSVSFQSSWQDTTMYSSAGEGSHEVIDLTKPNDPDEDLRRAVAASLQDHQPRSFPYAIEPDPEHAVSCRFTTEFPAGSELKEGREKVAMHSQNTCEATNENASASALVSSSLPTCANHNNKRQLQASPPSSTRTQRQKPRKITPVSALASQYSLRNRDKIAKPKQGLPEAASLTLTSPGVPTNAVRGRPFNVYGRKGRIRARRYSGLGTADSEWQGAGFSEDEQIRQALEASIQYHHNGPGMQASGARTPVLPPNLELGPHSKRNPSAPVALVAPFPSLDVTTAILQVMYALTPVRQAFLSYEPSDSRATDLINFWKGASPSEPDVPRLDVDGTTSTLAVDMTQRIQTLFAFMNGTQRSACLARDVSLSVPSNIIALGTDGSHHPSTIAKLFYDTLVFALVEASKVHATVVFPSQDQLPEGMLLEQAHVEFVNEKQNIFQSESAVAFTIPPSPLDGENPEATLPPQNASMSDNCFELVHDSVNADVYSCLRAALAHRGEGRLITEAAQVLNLTFAHRDDEATTPLVLQERLYLDSFMWDRRRGLRLDSELYSPAMFKLSTAMNQLQLRRKKLIGDNALETSELLQNSISYFEQLALNSEDDPIRLQMQKEAAPQLRKVVEALKKELEDTNQMMNKIETTINTKRSLVKQAAQAEANRDDWQSLAYDLQAVLVHQDQSILCYVKQPDATWWRISNGDVAAVSAQEATSDKRRDAGSAGIFWVSYAKHSDSAKPAEPCPEQTQTILPSNQSCCH